MKPGTILWSALVLGLFLTSEAVQAKKNNPNIHLVYDPQQTVAEAYASIPGNVRQHPLSIHLVDGRALANPALIGSRTNDDDQLFDLKATNEVVPFVEEILLRNAREWGVRVEDDADLVLAAELLTFQVTERDKAVGSTFKAEVRVAGQLQNRAGHQLWSGSAYGDATRYGKKLSNENCNEVLSDAMMEAFADLFSQPDLHHVWTGGRAPASIARSSSPQSEAVSPEELLRELKGLLDQGFSAETLAAYVDNKRISRSMTAEDLAAWKVAGVPEEVIRLAMSRPVG
jgi:hypothetical protein